MADGTPKPDEIHILEGTWRGDRHGDPTTAVTAEGVPECPPTLRGVARELWDSVVPELIKTGLAHARDCADLAVMCQWWERYRKLSDVLDKMAVKNPDYGKVFYQTVKASDAFTAAAARFGMSPLDRTKMRQPVGRKRDGGVASRKRG